VHKMLVKEQRLFEQQQLLLQEVVRVLTHPFDAYKLTAAAAGGGEGEAGQDSSSSSAVYMPGVPAAAWRGLQLACYLGHRLLRLWQDGTAAVALAGLGSDGADAAAAAAGGPVGVAVGQLQQQLSLWEFELLQRHVWYSLQRGLGHCLNPREAGEVAAQQWGFVQQQQQQQQLVLPKLGDIEPDAAAAAAAALSRGQTTPLSSSAGTAAAAAGSSAAAAAAAAVPGPGSYPLSEMLMADWVMLNLHHPALNAESLMTASAAVYSRYKMEAPLLSLEAGEPLPARELNPLDPRGSVGLPAVGVSGEAVEAAGWARVPLSAAAGGGDGEKVPWPRCSVSLQLCGAEGGVGVPWGCSSCGRRYGTLPCRALLLPAPPLGPDQQQQQQEGGGVACVPQCCVCGVRLSPGGAAAAGIAGCSRLPRGVVDGSPVLSVGTSLSDVVLD
jgi:hypothetical protein